LDFINTVIANQFIVLGISVGIGAWAGKKIKYKTFNLGLIAGSLFMSVFISAIIGKTINITYDIPDQVKSIFFALFIFGIGIEAGSTFFKSLNKKTLILLSTTLVTSLVGLILVVIAAYLFDIDKGLAAGLAAGGLTQSSIIGAAGDSLSKLNLSPESIKAMQLNIAVGYSMTYIMGSFLPILLTTGLIPLVKKWNLRKAAVDLALEQSKGKIYLEPGQFEAICVFTTRVYEVGANAKIIGKNINDLFVGSGLRIAIEAIVRDGENIEINRKLTIEKGDIVAVTAHTGDFCQVKGYIGEEVVVPKEMVLIKEKRSVIVTNKKYFNVKISDIDPADFSNVFVLEVKRQSETLPVDRNFIIKKGDELVLLGKTKYLNYASKDVGKEIKARPMTDFTAFGLFLALGFAIGMLTFSIFGVSITLGSGIGCLLSGILLGWLHTRRPLLAGVPQGAINWLKDFGLAAFVAIVGLNAGLEALNIIAEHGPTIFILGIFISTIPMICAWLWIEYVLKIKNSINIVATINGSRSSNPGFASVLNAAGNATPIQYFTPTYTLAQITQTFVGVLVVYIVPFVV